MHSPRTILLVLATSIVLGSIGVSTASAVSAPQPAPPSVSASDVAPEPVESNSPGVVVGGVDGDLEAQTSQIGSSPIAVANASANASTNAEASSGPSISCTSETITHVRSSGLFGDNGWVHVHACAHRIFGGFQGSTITYRTGAVSYHWYHTYVTIVGSDGSNRHGTCTHTPSVNSSYTCYIKVAGHGVRYSVYGRSCFDVVNDGKGHICTPTHHTGSISS